MPRQTAHNRRKRHIYAESEIGNPDVEGWPLVLEENHELQWPDEDRRNHEVCEMMFSIFVKCSELYVHIACVVLEKTGEINLLVSTQQSKHTSQRVNRRQITDC